MKSLPAVLVLLLAACQSNAVVHEASLASTTPTSAPISGPLVVVGGGGTTDEIIQKALALAGGPGARMLVVAQASSDPNAGAESKTFWMEHGATNVGVLDATDPEGARAAIEQAAFLWMPGGDQSRLMETLDKAGLVDAIRKRHRAGAVVGGTSAGAAVISEVMLIGGDKADLKSVRNGGSETSAGLGLWPAAIVDQHFVQRQRFTRLLACVLDHPERVGVGIDEKTAVVVQGDRLEVVGESTVIVVDPRGASRSSAGAGELHSSQGLALHVLHRGDVLTLARPAAR